MSSEFPLLSGAATFGYTDCDGQGLPTPQESPVVWLPNHGHILPVGVLTARILAENRQSDPGWTLVEFSVPPHYEGTARPYRAQWTNVFYVLSGTLTFTMGQAIFCAPAGSCVWVGHAESHKFANLEPVPATCLHWCATPELDPYLDTLAG
jgi:mannose-6-phosphate isomerase-like protein (cupin superfamily)